jgi:hypothetical protein
MKPNEDVDLEAIFRKYPHIREAYNKPMPPITRKPKSKPAVLAPVSDKMAEAVKANPESLRLSAKGDDGVTVIERPWEKRPTSNMTVIEVDANGRPLLAYGFDRETGSYGTVQFQGGYGPPTPNTKAAEMRAGAKHEYNPLDALKGRDDE